MNPLEQYLQETFSVRDRPKSEKEMAKKLPLYLRNTYDLMASSLDGKKLIWAEMKTGNHITPDQLKKQKQVLQEYLGPVTVVFVFDNLETWERKRLIEKKVGFVEPFRQLYIPELYTQIKEGGKKESAVIPANNKVKPPTQLLLLYHLQRERLEEKYFHEIAKLLNYSPMTITRSVKELASLELLKSGKERYLAFTAEGKNLWDKALPFLDSPVRETWYLDDLPASDYLREGGETALSKYSMLSEPEQRTEAIGKDAYRLTKILFNDLDKKFGHDKLEVWHYDPTLLTDTHEVDKLSLYLSLKGHEDERVQGALERMITDLKW